jgi:integrase
MPTNLTTKFIERAKGEPGKRSEFRDEDVPGLILRVTPAGIKSWSFMYAGRDAAGKRTNPRVAIGEFPGTGLADARDVARKLRDRVARGDEPARDKAVAASRKAAEAARLTFDALADLWLAKYAEPKKVAAAVYDDKLMLNKDVRPRIGNKAADAVSRGDIESVIDAIVARGARVRATRCLKLIRAIYNWGRKAQRVSIANPANDIDTPADEKPRDRVLSGDEIRTFWRTIDDAPMTEGTRLAMRLSLVIGQRIGQVQRMAKNEVDLATGSAVWTVRGSGTKNGELVRIPLSPMAVRLIGEAAALSGNSAYMFPSPRGGKDAPVHTKAASRAMTRARGGKGFGIEHFTTHDLRRTCASLMAAIGIQLGTISHILDHISVTKSSVTTAVYIKYSFDREKRIALEAWATKLQHIIDGTEASQEGTNVVALPLRASGVAS